MNKALKEKQIHTFMLALFEASDVAPALGKVNSPLSILSHIYLHKAGFMNACQSIYFDKLPAERKFSRDLIHFIISHFTESNKEEKIDGISYLIQNYPQEVDCLCPDFILQKVKSIIEKTEHKDIHEDSLESLITDYICSNRAYHKLLDSILLFIENRNIHTNSLARYLSAKKADLKENAFYNWIIKQSFIQKMDYAELGLGNAPKLQTFVERDKMLGTVCFLDLGTEDLKHKFHNMLQKKYKSSKMPDMFMDFFSQRRQENDLFGRVVVIFAYNIIMFKLDDYEKFYQKIMLPEEYRQDSSSFAHKDYCYKILEGFQSGIKIDFISSHFRLSHLKDQEVIQKIAFIFLKKFFWKKKSSMKAVLSSQYSIIMLKYSK
ncbi:hypothetical protein [Desulfonatronospira sp.]|uniref:hypothetical protein n=1 Tax=Desulfonatronospira sp. TaxID=1962951 RepID=UPI0025BBC2AD|nr:hypothetical protein [Desulfonatronospira sp.]